MAATHLHAGLRQLQAQGQLLPAGQRTVSRRTAPETRGPPPGPPAPLPGEHVGVVRLAECALQLLQLEGAEGRPVPPLLALTPAQQRGLEQRGAARGGRRQQWGFAGGAAGGGHRVALGLAALLRAWRGEVGVRGARRPWACSGGMKAVVPHHPGAWAGVWG